MPGKFTNYRFRPRKKTPSKSLTKSTISTYQNGMIIKVNKLIVSKLRLSDCGQQLISSSTAKNLLQIVRNPLL